MHCESTGYQEQQEVLQTFGMDQVQELPKV